MGPFTSSKATVDIIPTVCHHKELLPDVRLGLQRYYPWCDVFHWLSLLLEPPFSCSQQRINLCHYLSQQNHCCGCWNTPHYFYFCFLLKSKSIFQSISRFSWIKGQIHTKSAWDFSHSSTVQLHLKMVKMTFFPRESQRAHSTVTSWLYTEKKKYVLDIDNL